MWEYNQIHGNARSSVLMHADHKYVDKFRDAKGNWRYVYDTAKSGASRAASATASAAKADTQKGMKNLESYRKLYMMLSNGSYPMNYVDPVSGRTVTVKDRSGAAQAKANIALAANKVYQDNNKRFSMMNQKDPDIGNMAQQNERVMEMFNSVKKQYIGKETA